MWQPSTATQRRGYKRCTLSAGLPPYAALAVSISSVYLPKRALLLHQAR
jgi:hypothetical protein